MSPLLKLDSDSGPEGIVPPFWLLNPLGDVDGFGPGFTVVVAANQDERSSLTNPAIIKEIAM